MEHKFGHATILVFFDNTCKYFGHVADCLVGGIRYNVNDIVTANCIWTCIPMADSQNMSGRHNVNNFKDWMTHWMKFLAYLKF